MARADTRAAAPAVSPSADSRDGAAGLERRPPVGTRCASAQRTAIR